MANSVDIVVVGAGIIGIALAARLAAHDRKVVLMDMVSSAPLCATARSAALYDPIRVPSAEVAALTLAGVAMMAGIPNVLAPQGVLHLFGAADLALYADTLARSRAVGGAVVELEGEKVVREFPFLHAAGTEDIAALFAPPGVARAIDLDRLHEYFRGVFCAAGGSILFNEAVESAAWSGGAWTIRTCSRILRAGVIVNCAGASADFVAERCGVEPIGLERLKHTVVEATLVDHPLLVTDRPAVFWEGVSGDLNCNFRRAGRILIALPDTVPPATCESMALRDDVGDMLDRFRARTVFDVTSADPIRWTGVQAVTRDQKPVIGWAQAKPNFFWATGFGGFGTPCAAAASAIGADLILGRARFRKRFEAQGIAVERFSPARARLSAAAHVR